VEKPRHIEVQVFGDGTRAVHLFERDCSLQRRHQKVIEEAPAPGMTAEMRAEMGAAAVRAAEAIGYSGRGHGGVHRRRQRRAAPRPVLLHGDEHAAAGGASGDGGDHRRRPRRMAVARRLGGAAAGAQADLSITGHAIEARLYAEDVPAGFLPATGRLEHLRFGEGARADTGVGPGDEISPWYDPMIAKLIVHGATREIALKQMDRALATTEVAGATTNLAFLRRLVGHERFASGDVDTGLIEADLEALVAAPGPPGVIARAALAAMGLDGRGASSAGFSLWAPLRQSVR
jgi:3-methylcrotonyl-CoA carboxylase alpha subunit